MPDIAYPETERGDLVEEHFSERIADPYRWLEGDARGDRKLVAWIEAQNAVTQEYLGTLPGRDVFRKRMTELLNYERFTVPLKRGERYFFTRNDGVANQASLFVGHAAAGQDRLLIDPNAWSTDNADALAEWAPSDDGRFLAFGVQTGGTDWRTIKVLNVDTDEQLDDAVEWARFTRLAWVPDGSGFFYSRYPEPEAGTAVSARVVNHAVYFHRLGTPQTEDRLIYYTPDRPGLLHVADRAVDGRYLHISSTPGSNESALTVVDLSATDWTPRTVVASMDAEWTVLGNDGAKLILITTDGAERRRVVSLDLAAPEPQPVEIVPEAEGSAVLNDAALLGGKLLIGYLVDAKTEIRRFDMDGKPDGTVALPSIGTAGGLTGNPAEDEAFFVFTSYNVPTTIYRYDVAANTIEPWAESKVAIDLSSIVVEQRFFRSKDGTWVPLFLIRRTDITRAAPTLLYGYGGFGISQVPIYNSLQLAWVEQGGVLAVANIRGGGEYGRAWHRAGQLENRQNVFDDFIAAGEFLKAEGVTPPNGLAIQGESGGGLVVGAVTNQRPDLFDVALPGVGVMDMLRYDKFTAGMFWMGEYGSPAEERHFRNLMTYSPYHTIKAGADYPAILATTADADDRVVPAHTFKYVAALQAADIGPRPHLVRIETRAGHGAGMPLDKIIALHADMWAFAAHWTGLKVGA
ncbi:prolyl oligopeptidase family protein [Bradyrhizobium neotropicale]|uniref:prolyl oligopeptidase family serine peptidase n=1 Tax=Bradyrhizobium neotropicale TaxID=1497615 RepID=UPI001AD67514|nr:prolyl oligopeptidase family serine peptidase [Bradyrhizobium neotropicale]MBO4227020.1 prolyl oligopeptidase family serine peptidase [Bradyrhizobium neotropicale]